MFRELIAISSLPMELILATQTVKHSEKFKFLL